MAFKDLIADLAGLAAKEQPDLTKSQGGEADDANIQAAGATGGDSGDGGEGAAGDEAAGTGAAGGDDDAGAGGDTMAKSFEVTLENGQKFEAVDASEMLKALTDRLEDVETSAGEALGMAVTLLKSQATQIESLTASVQKLAGSGSGRQAVLSILPKGATATPAAGGSTMAKSEADKGMKPGDFLLKAESAYDGGKLTARELQMVETLINRAEQIPANLIQKVMAANGAVA